VKITDNINATWTPPTLSKQTFNFPIKVRIVYPSSETTVAAGWDGDGLGLWGQTLHNANDTAFDWSLNKVQETDPGGGSPSNDTCWCTAFSINQFWQITGGPVGGWLPDDTGKWEFDHVGWYNSSVRYYRTKRRAPCGTTFPQQMEFQATNVSGPWTNYGNVNTLGGSFDYTRVVSTRAGQTQHHMFDPQPITTRLACKFFSPVSRTVVSAKFGDIITVDD